LTGGFKGVRRRKWSKIKIKIFNKKKFSAVSTFSGAFNGNHTIFLGLIPSGVMEGGCGGWHPPNNLEGGWHPPNNQVSRGML
jgi:hypothetical protein